MKTRTAAATSRPALKNAAVTRCLKARERTYNAELAKGKDDYDSRQASNRAYREAMPPLSGHQCICDFIACVTHGILIDALQYGSSNKLLYAAQVALCSFRSQTQKQQTGA
jgi:hypothetical protein